MGFDLVREDVEPAPGWYFVIAEQPTGPRFGLDVPTGGNAGPATWTDLHWGHVGVDSGDHLSLADSGLLNSTKRLAPSAPSATFGRNSAHMAAITFQRPFRAVVHTSELLDGVDGIGVASLRPVLSKSVLLRPIALERRRWLTWPETWRRWPSVRAELRDRRGRASRAHGHGERPARHPGPPRPPGRAEEGDRADPDTARAPRSPSSASSTPASSSCANGSSGSASASGRHSPRRPWPRWTARSRWCCCRCGWRPGSWARAPSCASGSTPSSSMSTPTSPVSPGGSGELARRYWDARWAAKTAEQRAAAWQELVRHVRPTRARYLVDVSEPTNLARPSAPASPSCPRSRSGPDRSPARPPPGCCPSSGWPSATAAAPRCSGPGAVRSSRTSRSGWPPTRTPTPTSCSPSRTSRTPSRWTTPSVGSSTTTLRWPRAWR